MGLGKVLIPEDSEMDPSLPIWASSSCFLLNFPDLSFKAICLCVQVSLYMKPLVFILRAHTKMLIKLGESDEILFPSKTTLWFVEC